MNPTIYNFTLDLQSAVSQAVLSARKGDRARFASVTFMSGGVPYAIEHGCYAVLNAVRESDGAILFADCIIKDDTVTFNVSDLASGKEGRVDCDLTLYSPSGEAITSPRFAVVVYAGTTTGEDIESMGDYKTLYDLYSGCMDAKEAAEFAASVAAGGGAISFNGRIGAVDPAYGDYTAEMVGADPAGTADSAVATHNADNAAHSELFRKCSKEGHKHDASDISDISSAISAAMATAGTAKIATASASKNGSVVTVNYPGFAPKFVVLMGSYSGAITTTYAMYGMSEALVHGHSINSEDKEEKFDRYATVVWSSEKMAISCGEWSRYESFKFVAIG